MIEQEYEDQRDADYAAAPEKASSDRWEGINRTSTGVLTGLARGFTVVLMAVWPKSK